jgi:hypothetical protein
MFKLRKKTKAPLADVKTLQRWIDALPLHDPIATGRTVVAELAKVSERAARRTPSTLSAVLAVDAHLTDTFARLASQYVQHASRSSKVEQQLWQALFDLTQSFLACYALFAQELADRALHAKYHSLVTELIARQLIHFGHDAKIRMYRCERWIPGKWIELHTLFTQACSLEIERQPLRLSPSGRSTTIEHEYIAVLILQLADPGNLTAQQIEWIAARLDDWCRPLRLSVEPRSATTFYIDLAGSIGLKRRALGTLEGRVLFVDTEPLHARLLKNCASLEQAIAADPQSEKADAMRGELQLIAKVVRRVDPEFRPIPRHGERVPASGVVDAIVGFDNIASFIHRDARKLPSAREAERNFGSAMQLAVFGRALTENTSPEELERRRLAAFVTPGGPWELKDASASGYRLQAPMAVATEITLSMLVAIHQQESERWAIGIVRRMRRLSANRAEIGLQLIANTLAAADFVQKKAHDPDGPPTGSSSVTDHKFRGLYLTYIRRPGEPAIQSLIVPSDEYHPSKPYVLQMGDTTRAIRFGRVLERHGDWVWTGFEPRDSAIALANAAPGA